MTPTMRLDLGCKLSCYLLSLSLYVDAEPCLFSKLGTDIADVFGEYRRTCQLHYPADCAVQLLLGK